MLLISLAFLTLFPAYIFARALEARGVECSFASTANSGDTCDSFSTQWGITVETFVLLNPTVNCPNLSEGVKYCVIGTVSPEAPSSTSTLISTSAPQPTSAPKPTSTSKSNSAPKPTSVETTSKPAPPPTKTTTTSQKITTTTSANPHSPTQPGLAKNCDKFHRVASGDSCHTIGVKYKITLEQFRKWNPAINAECSNLWLDYYVCVHIPGATMTSAKPSPTPKGPQPQMPGIVSNCKKFHQIKSGDTCFTINKAANITLAQFRSWNKEIDASCSNLWLGYYVCIGV